jgi:MerR family transcriptional regulator/heat shock protein HspR
MTAELGMNLAGVERVFELEEQLERVTKRMKALERQADQVRREMEQEIERVRRSLRAEIVPYQGRGEIVRARDVQPLRIPVRRPADGRA